MTHLIFDTELMGTHHPAFLICIEEYETGQRWSFWDENLSEFVSMLNNPDYTWVGFNSAKFDLPVISAVTDGIDLHTLKQLAQDAVNETPPWTLAHRYDYAELELDHIDLFDVAPGVKISLKAYMARIGYPTLVDLPFDHTHDLTDSEREVVEAYCWNDIGGTKELFTRLRKAIDLRVQLSQQYGVDLRSKSDAQCAEAIFKTALCLGKTSMIPRTVEYRAPDFVQTDSEVINDLLDKVEWETFKINPENGSPIEPDWMQDTVKLGCGTYKFGLGGLHSTHDKRLYLAATDEMLISDFDVASYYPNIIMKAGIVPEFGGNKGGQFLDMYNEIYEQRMVAKRAKDKNTANSLKILLNGTFGKLGNRYSSFYSPDLMLAVTITGQLNLLCLVHELEKLPDTRVISANTDGIMVHYPTTQRDAVLAVIEANSQMTEFEYEETPYKLVAMKDVNNYVAITTSDEVKAKGLYASNREEENPLYLMKNPAMEVCCRMMKDYLLHGWLPEDSIREYTDPTDYMACRTVKGGGVQHTQTIEVDDWELIEDYGNAQNIWWSEQLGKKTKRKSRPKPGSMGVGGKPFGRVARWYMSTRQQPPLTYVSSGNKVPDTDGAQLCLTLPEILPDDLDRDWYIQRTCSMLDDVGCPIL